MVVKPTPSCVFLVWYKLICIQCLLHIFQCPAQSIEGTHVSALIQNTTFDLHSVLCIFHYMVTQKQGMNLYHDPSRPYPIYSFTFFPCLSDINVIRRLYSFLILKTSLSIFSLVLHFSNQTFVYLIFHNFSSQLPY